MNHLLDRYLNSVNKYLPWQRQADILAELRANLEAQLEDKEEELGRPLIDAEMEAWLKQFGPPIHMAARYMPQRSLIGPELFPFFWFVLRMALLWSAIIASIVTLIQMFAEQKPVADALLAVVLRVPGALFSTAMWITLVFAAIELAARYYPEAFKNTPLAGLAPPVPPTPFTRSVPPGKKERSFVYAASKVIFEFALVAWMLLFPRYPFLLLGPGMAFLAASPYTIAPILITFYWVVVAFNALQLAWHATTLWNGTWQRPHPFEEVILKLLGLTPMFVLLTAPAHVFVLLKHPEVDAAHYGGWLNQINDAAFKGICIVCAIVVVQIVWEFGKALMQRDRA